MKTEDMSNALTRFTSALLSVMFYGGILVTASMPWLVRWMARYYPVLSRHYWLHTVLFMLAGAGAVLIIRELRRMFRTVLDNDCFVRQNVVSLRRMGRLGLGIALVTTVVGLLKARVGKRPQRRAPAPGKAKRKRSR